VTLLGKLAIAADLTAGALLLSVASTDGLGVWVQIVLVLLVVFYSVASRVRGHVDRKARINSARALSQFADSLVMLKRVLRRIAGDHARAAAEVTAYHDCVYRGRLRAARNRAASALDALESGPGGTA